jgi:hypothetical protein
MSTKQLYVSGFYDQRVYSCINSGIYFITNDGVACEWCITNFHVPDANNFSVPYDGQKNMYIFSFDIHNLEEHKDSQMYQLMQQFSGGKVVHSHKQDHDWIFLTDQTLPNYDHDTGLLDVDYDTFGGCIHYAKLN